MILLLKRKKQNHLKKSNKKKFSYYVFHFLCYNSRYGIDYFLHILSLVITRFNSRLFKFSLFV